MSKLSSLMEAAKQNKKKTAIIAVVVVLVLAALFMRFKGGSKGGSGGGPGGPAPEGEMPPLPKVGDKCDVNPFLSVTGTPEQFIVTTRTGSGSLFCFTGALQEDRPVLTLHVTDETDGIRAVPQ